jgi:hypothetical protein
MSDLNRPLQKRCKYCDEEISAKAKICPHCRKNQNSNTGGAIFLLIVGLIFSAFPFIMTMSSGYANPAGFLLFCIPGGIAVLWSLVSLIKN